MIEMLIFANDFIKQLKMKLKVIFWTMLISGICSAQTNDDRGYLVKVGDMAPDFSMKLTDGTTVKLSDLRGKLVLLQFTASWCGVCRKEMPFIESDIWQKNKKNPKFVLLGIDFKETPEVAAKF